MAGEKPLAWILLSVPVSYAVQVATLNLGDYFVFQCMFPKDALDLFHLSESAVKSKLGDDAKENKRQRRIWEKVKIPFLFLYATIFSFISMPFFLLFFCL